MTTLLSDTNTVYHARVFNEHKATNRAFTTIPEATDWVEDNLRAGIMTHGGIERGTRDPARPERGWVWDDVPLVSATVTGPTVVFTWVEGAAA